MVNDQFEKKTKRFRKYQKVGNNLVKTIFSLLNFFTDLDKLNLVNLGNGGLVLGLKLLPQLPHKMKLASKVVDSDSKIVIPLC